METAYLSQKEICDRFKMSRSTLYRKIQSGDFPQPIKLFAKKQVWHKEQLVVMESKLLADRGIYI